MKNMSQDNEDIITNPFYYAQDVERYFEKIEDPPNANKQHEVPFVKPRKPLRKRKSFVSTQTSITTNIIRRTTLRKGQKLIKICIYDVKDPEDDNSYYSDSGNSSLSAQYVVKENHNYDVIMDAATSLIKQIGKKVHDFEE